MEFYRSSFIALLVICVAGCSEQNDAYEEDFYSEEGYQNENGMADPSAFQEGNGRPTQQHAKVVMHPVMDTKRGMEMARMPLPANWKIVTPQTAEDPNLVGPGGIKGYYRSGGMYNYSQDPYMQQMYQQSGQQMRAPISAAQILEQDIVPNLRKEGLQMVKQYPLPQIAQRSKAYNSKLFKSLPSQDTFDAIGSEWVDNKGNQMLVIVDECVSTGQGSTFWYYQLRMLEAPKAVFEGAKKAVIYGIVNTQDNPQQIAAYNAEEQQKTNQSWAQHNAKMQRNQQAFDQQQAAHRSSSEAINNSIMSTWRNNNASSDRMQHNTINAISGEETVTNPYDGQQYQVESGSDQYWMNSSGEYIQSDDAFYNPNQDNGVNNQDWQEVETEW